jgi:hypothetical protein
LAGDRDRCKGKGDRDLCAKGDQKATYEDKSCVVGACVSLGRRSPEVGECE